MRGAPRGSNAHGGPLVTLLSEEQEDHDDDLLDDIVNLDEGDGEVVRGGVEPLDGGHHAAVVNCTQELRLVEEILVKFV